MNRAALKEKMLRLRQMPPHEISYRTREKLRAEAERVVVTLTGPLLFRSTDLPFDALAQRFYSPVSAEGCEGARKFVRDHFPEWIDRAVGDADGLCAHRVALLNCGELDLGPRIDWHRDPLTGKRWDVRFWADYNLVRDSPAGDPKLIHELNRQQHLPRLAKAHLLTGERRYAREALNQMESWMAQNPVGVGINWHSSLEIALRTISWLWTIAFLLAAGAIERSRLEQIGRSLVFQLDHIWRYPSTFSSPNTHLLAEAASLFMAGLLFEGCEPAQQWRQFGATVLAGEIERQVLADGVHAELSPYYHCYALDFYLQAFVLARRNGFALLGLASDRIVSMLDFLMQISRPDRTIPLIGDDDGGRSLALNYRDYRSFMDGLSTGAVLFGRGDFKSRAGDFAEETFWLLGEDAWQQWTSLPERQPSETCAAFTESGYAVQRSGWDGNASHLIFDFGGLGMMGGGHAHADALSVSLFSAGADLLPDSGTYVYNGAPEWRNFFRSTRAHNTVVIDGQDQADIAGTFAWKSKPAARLHRHNALADFEYIECEHRAYTRLSGGLVHRRGLLFVKPEYWVIVDRFEGDGEHNFDFYYHFAPGAKLTISPERGRLSDISLGIDAGVASLLLYICATSGITADISCGQESPPQGWISSGYGEKQPAPVLRASAHGSASLMAVSALAPFSAATAQRLELQGGAGIACALDHNSGRDVVLIPAGDEALQAGGFTVRGALFWLRLRDGMLLGAFAVNASSLIHDGRIILERSQPMDCYLARFGKGEVMTDAACEVLCAESAGS